MKNEIKYIDEHISDELEGAECYFDKAVECKDKGNTAHAQMYLTMATQELGHAEGLMKMQDEHVKKWDTEHPHSKEYDNVYRDIWEEYREDKMDKYNKLKDKINKMK